MSSPPRAHSLRGGTLDSRRDQSFSLSHDCRRIDETRVRARRSTAAEQRRSAAGVLAVSCPGSRCAGTIVSLNSPQNVPRRRRSGIEVECSLLSRLIVRLQGAAGSLCVFGPPISTCVSRETSFGSARSRLVLSTVVLPFNSCDQTDWGCCRATARRRSAATLRGRVGAVRAPNRFHALPTRRVVDQAPSTSGSQMSLATALTHGTQVGRRLRAVADLPFPSVEDTPGSTG